MGSLLNTLCEPCYSCKLKINGKECSRLIPFSVQTSTYSNSFFYKIQLNLPDFPDLLTPQKNRFAVLFSRSSKRVITDQIFWGLEEMLSILLGFRKHVRYVCMHARMNCSCSKGSSASTLRDCLEIKRKNTSSFLPFEKLPNKMTNLVSDLFILLSVHPMWGKDGVG